MSDWQENFRDSTKLPTVLLPGEKIAAALTLKQIRAAHADEELLNLLPGELKQIFPPGLSGGPVVFLSRLQRAPAGFRATVATYDLDVSMAMDDCRRREMPGGPAFDPHDWACGCSEKGVCWHIIN